MPRKIAWAFVALVLLFLVAPVFVVIPLSFSSSAFLEFPPPGYTTRWYGEFLDDRSWTDAVMRSLRVAGGAVVISVVIGTAAAYGIVRGSRRFIILLEPLFVAPLVVPVIVFAVGAYLVSIRLGFLGSLWVVSAAHAVLAVPFVVLNVAAALRTMDSRLELVAQTLGASRLRAMRHVTLPLIAPAVIAGALLSAVLSMDETVAALFLTPDVAPTLPVRMYSSIRFELDPLVPVASTLVIGITAVLGGCILVTRLATRGKQTAASAAIVETASLGARHTDL